MSDRKPLLGGGAKESAGEKFDKVQAELRRLQTQIRTSQQAGIPYTKEMETHALGLVKESEKLKKEMTKEIQKMAPKGPLPLLPEEKRALKVLGQSEEKLKEEMRKAERRAKAKASPVAKFRAPPKTAGGGGRGRSTGGGGRGRSTGGGGRGRSTGGRGRGRS